MATLRASGATFRLLAVPLVMGLIVGCATVPPPLLTRRATHLRDGLWRTAASDRDDARRAAVVTQARRMLAGAPFVVGGFEFEPDPVGFVRAAYWAADIDVFDPTIARDGDADGMMILFRSASARNELYDRTPRPGDLAFFDGASGRVDLYPTQVGIVETAAPNGTMTVIGSFARGPTRVALNLRTPDRSVSKRGTATNTLLASSRQTQTTAAHLFRSFADPF